MTIGFVGLGKMGIPMVARLCNGRHDVIAYDTNPSAVRRAKQFGATIASDLSDMARQLGKHPVVWLMVPAQFVDEIMQELLELLPRNSIIIDGGNSDYRKTLQRYSRCLEKGIELVDVGTSGGTLGAYHGFSMMAGGTPEAVRRIEPFVKTLAQPQGYRHFGPTGAGHYIKMVHNAIEYGVMEAYAEGYQLLKEGPFKGLDLARIADVWQRGSIIASTLNGLSRDILTTHPELRQTDGYVTETGEADWALQVARDHDITMPAIAAAVAVRKASENGEVSFATKLLAALRHAFGGHPLRKP